MRQGFRVIDSDTHVNPCLDVLLRYADSDLQERIDDLGPYRRTAKAVPGRADAEDVDTYTILSVKPVHLQRVAGEKSRPATRHSRNSDPPTHQRLPSTRCPRNQGRYTPSRHRCVHRRSPVPRPRATPIGVRNVE